MDLAEVRRQFAAALSTEHGIRSERLRNAFAEVPRERFLDRGPWLVFTPEGYTSTPSADPAHLYDAGRSVAIDVARFINNSSPGLVAGMIDALDLREGDRVIHVGCGTGYYAAVLAEVVGRAGSVLAVEIERDLAARARRNLRKRKCVQVVHGDGTELEVEPADALLVSAGATHPHAVWLDALRPGGRLVVPLTGVRPPRVSARVVRDHAGRVLRVQRVGAGYAARFIEGVAIPPLFGGRDPEMQRRLAAALQAGGADRVRSLRREGDEPDETCWLRGEDFCLSTREPRSP